MRKSTIYHSLFPLFLTVGALLALITPFGPGIGGFIAFSWAVGLGWVVGDALLSNESPWWKTFIGSLTFVAGTIVLASVVYVLWKLDGLATGAVVLASSAVAARLDGYIRQSHLLNHSSQAVD